MSTQIDAYIAKYGELHAFSIIEIWERSRGIRHQEAKTLEDRWSFFIRETDKYLDAPTVAAMV